MLLSAAEHWVRERGGQRIRMNVVNVRDTLIVWYVRRGYHKTGETEPFSLWRRSLARRSETISASWSLRKTLPLDATCECPTG
jgi:hypothetical protein